MNWAAMRPAIKTLTQSITGLSAAGQVEWKGTRQASYSRKFPRVDLSMRSVGGVGWDEVRRVDNATQIDPLLPQTWTVCGQRKLVLTVRIETDNQDDTHFADNYADLFRTRLNRPSSLQALRDVGLAFSSIEDTQMVEYKSQDRQTSVAVIDVHLNAAENDTDASSDAGEFIKSVQFESQFLDDPNGNPSALQVNAEVDA